MEQPVDLVEYVHNMLAEGVPFKRISEALSISDPRRLKRLMSKALGQKFRVFDNSIVEEVSNKIDALVPMGTWGQLGHFSSEECTCTFECEAFEEEDCKSSANLGRYIPLNFII